MFLQFIRVNSNTEPELLWKLLSEYWKMPSPKIIISITGGAQAIDIKPSILNGFKRALINAAKTSGKEECFVEQLQMCLKSDLVYVKEFKHTIQTVPLVYSAIYVWISQTK